MKPVKKGNGGIVISLLFLIFAVFCALHGAGAFGDFKSMPAEVVNAQAFRTFSAYFDCFSARLQKPAMIQWNEYSQNWAIGGFLVWLITVLYIYSNQRKYISGKEYGTSKWGGLRDISDLFASNMLKTELRKARMVKNGLTRHFAKRAAMKEVNRDGKNLLAIRMRELREQERDRKSVRQGNRKLYRENAERIRGETRKIVDDAMLEAWKPLKMQNDYEDAAADISRRYDQRHLSESERDAELKKAKTRLRDSLRHFYKGKGKKAELRRRYKDSDALLTASEKACIYNYKVNNNVLIIGGSGSGKTRGFVMPNVLQAHSSYVITDPKGEILEKAGKFLSEFQGYDIRVLNLDNKTRSDGYNPFVYIHAERAGYEDRVLALIKTIIVNTDGGEKRNSSDPFWEKAEELFLLAIFYFVCDGFPPDEQNMNTVLKLIAMLEIKEERDDNRSDLDLFSLSFARDYGENHIGVQMYREFRSKASGKTAKSIVISAVARLTPFRTPEVRRLFSYDTMNLADLGEKKMAIFVVLPPTDTTHNFIAGMLFTQMFQELQYCATEMHRHDGQRLPVPVRFVLDEFANTCTIPNFTKILAYARSFGIGIVPILQSLEQIKDMYKDEWGVIVDNCQSLLFLGSVKNMDTLEYISKMLGKGTFDKRTSGRTFGIKGSSSHNYDRLGRELMDAAEISKLPKDDCLLLISGRNPFYSKKYTYERHPNYRLTSDGNRSYAYNHTPVRMQDPPMPPLQVAKEEPKAARAEHAVDYAKLIAPDCGLILVDASPGSVLAHVNKHYGDMVPTGDDKMRVNDGEAKFSAEDLLRDFADEESDSDILEILSLSADPEYMITVDGSPLGVLAAVSTDCDNFEVVRDEKISVQDGERKFTEEQSALIEALLTSGRFESDTSADELAELESMMDGFDGVAGRIDALAQGSVSSQALDMPYSVLRGA